jgi:hypothetical protein
MVLRHGTEPKLPTYSVGDVVTLELPPARLTRSTFRHSTCLTLAIPTVTSSSFSVSTAFSSHFTLQQICVNWLQDMAEGFRQQYLDFAPEIKLTIQQVIKLASSGKKATRFCAYATKYTSGRCKGMQS